MSGGLSCLISKGAQDSYLEKLSNMKLPPNISLNKKKLKPTTKINDEIIFNISNIHHIGKIYFSRNCFEKCWVDLGFTQMYLDNDYNQILNQYNNTPNKLNFWFTMENNFLPINEPHNIKIHIILENSSLEDELLIETFSRDFNFDNHIDFIMEEQQINEFNLYQGVNHVKLDLNHPIKELYFMCTDANNNKGEFIDNLSLILNGHTWIENLDKEFMLILNQIQKNKIIKNLYYLPLFLQKDKYGTVGTLNASRIDSINLHVSTNKSCKVKIIAVNHNVCRIAHNMFGIAFSN